MHTVNAHRTPVHNGPRLNLAEWAQSPGQMLAGKPDGPRTEGNGRKQALPLPEENVIWETLLNLPAGNDIWQPYEFQGFGTALIESSPNGD
jgi:hypothetical protein